MRMDSLHMQHQGQAVATPLQTAPSHHSNGQKTKVRQIWTPDEDRVLSRAVAKETPSHGTISWHRVAAHLPGRNNKDCRKRWHYSVSHTIKKGTWTKDEDEKLLKAVEKYGARWSKVAAVVGSRNGDQCWKRWYDCLDPRIDKSPWTAEEDGKLLQAVEAVGRNWSEIVTNNFPNRTSLSAKNRYSILQRRRDHAVDAWVVTQKANASAAMPTDNLTPFQNPETSYLSPSTAASGAVPTGYDAASSTDSLQQSPSMIADNWYSDDLLSETSTPAFSPDLSWAQWSPCPSTLALSSSPQTFAAEPCANFDVPLYPSSSVYSGNLFGSDFEPSPFVGGDLSFAPGGPMPSIQVYPPAQTGRPMSQGLEYMFPVSWES